MVVPEEAPVDQVVRVGPVEVPPVDFLEAQVVLVDREVPVVVLNHPRI